MRSLLYLILLLVPVGAIAQSAATLVADQVLVSADDRLIAQGNIEAFYDGNRLTAESIVYDKSLDRLTITGPIVIVAKDGSILTATQATMDPRLENGVLQGARMVLNRQLQLAANQINRSEGRYSELYKAAVTSCQVCQGQSPLWEIRAKSIVHDNEERQLYFTGAQLRLKGVPIFYIPQMRLPDPSLDRATGWLLPRLRTTDKLGLGIKLPYFITLGDHRDLKLTPYLSDQTTTLELRYRQAFANGDLGIQAAASQDTLYDGMRSFVIAQGEFDLGNRLKLHFDIEAASDPKYLSTYGFSDKDRLDSAIGLTRITDDSLFATQLTYFQTQRSDETNASLPPLIADLTYEKRLNLGTNGTVRFGAGADVAFRYDDQDGDQGRDVTRIGIFADWRNRFSTDQGFVIRTNAGAAADFYQVNNDSRYAASGLRSAPYARVTLEYPLVSTGASGSRHLLTPTIMLSWSDSYGFTPPNEDSTRSELRMTNLFDADQFTGHDAKEEGLRATIGGTWTRIGANGTTSTLGFGRIIRAENGPTELASAGLAGKASDWVLTGQLDINEGLNFIARTRFNDSLELTFAEAMANWRSETLDLSAAYIWDESSPTKTGTQTLSEITVDTAIKLNDQWSLSADTRYDLIAGRPARTGLGVHYKNECVTVDLSASRRYSAVSTVEPETSYGLSVSLTGFSTGRSLAGGTARCDG